MMIIPAVDIMGGQVVRLVQGDPERKTIYGEDPAAMAEKWQNEGADMLHVVDLDATLGSGSNAELVEGITARLRIPVQAAGGLRDEKTAIRMAGRASRVVLGTLALQDRPALERLKERLGPDKIVVAADHADGRIMVRGWQERTEIWLRDAIRSFASMGLTEFLVTDVGRDGTMGGPNVDSLKEACRPGVNVIASGGISGPEDVKRVKDAGARGVILGRALYEGRITVREAKKLA